jgi:hypothetical protein
MAGTQRAACGVMAKSNDGLTLPLMVIEWTTIGVGVIMALAIFLMHC